MKFIYEHSLSIVLGLCFVVCNVAFFLAEPGTHLYDFLNMLAGCFGGSFIIVVLARFFWEKDSDPAKPPRKDCE